MSQQELEDKSYKEVQQICKQNGISAKGKVSRIQQDHPHPPRCDAERTHNPVRILIRMHDCVVLFGDNCFRI